MVILTLFVASASLWLYQQRTVIKEYQVGDTSVQLEVTQTVQDRIDGLSNRESIGKADGLLFVFPTSDRHAIWMKDMLFPIDIVWVREEKVIDIAPNVQPPSPGTLDNELDAYFPRLDADWVIEFPAGWAEEHGLKIGDPVVKARQ